LGESAASRWNSSAATRGEHITLHGAQDRGREIIDGTVLRDITVDAGLRAGEHIGFRFADREGHDAQ
jgi:hypothetical protein